MTTTSATTFVLPDLGEGLQDAEIVSWYVAPGDRVVADQPLVSVETDKAVVDVPSPRGGRIARIFGQPGDRIDVGEPLVEYEADGASPARDAGTVVGELPTDRDDAPAGAAAASAAVDPTAPSPTAPQGSPGTRVPAAPAVRAFARRLAVDLATITPSGSRGEVTMDDVEAAADAAGTAARPGRAETPRAAAEPAEEAAPRRTRASADLPHGYQPLRGVRRAMARNMAVSGAEVVPATVLDEADLHLWAPRTDTTARLVRAIVAGCAAAPALNAWLGRDGESRQLHRVVDIGLAVEAPDGLFTPVIRDAGSLDLEEIRKQVDELEAAARARRLQPEELRGATITLSNFGMLAGRHAALVVVPPQVAILGAGRAAPRPVAVGDAIAVHRVLPLSLTFDHRAATGGEAAAFLSAVIADLQPAK